MYFVHSGIFDISAVHVICFPLNFWMAESACVKAESNRYTRTCLNAGRGKNKKVTLGAVSTSCTCPVHHSRERKCARVLGQNILVINTNRKRSYEESKLI